MDQLIYLKEIVASDAMEKILFYLLSYIAIVFAVGVVYDTKVIRSGFLLIGVFGAISGIFLLLQAQFLALAQIMIYAVGITLVVVIALMLTNPRLEKEVIHEEEEVSHEPGLIRWYTYAKDSLPALVSIFLFITIAIAIRPGEWDISTEQVSMDNIEVLGHSLTTMYSLPFEFASVLLLAALIGAIMLAKGEKKVRTIQDTKVEEL